MGWPGSMLSPSPAPMTVGGELIPIVGCCFRYPAKLSFKVGK
jgi:hypothetical protein